MPYKIMINNEKKSEKEQPRLDESQVQPMEQESRDVVPILKKRGRSYSIKKAENEHSKSR